jgi:hypothetical protein
MKKGMIFTIDAVLALIVVIILLAMVPMQAMDNGGGKVSRNLGGRARDSAITAYYRGETASQSISQQATFGKCAVYYALDPNASDLEEASAPEENVFCEEA